MRRANDVAGSIAASRNEYGADSPSGDVLEEHTSSVGTQHEDFGKWATAEADAAATNALGSR